MVRGVAREPGRGPKAAARRRNAVRSGAAIRQASWRRLRRTERSPARGLPAGAACRRRRRSHGRPRGDSQGADVR